MWWHSDIGFGQLFVTPHTVMALLSLALFLVVLIVPRLRVGEADRPACPVQEVTR